MSYASFIDPYSNQMRDQRPNSSANSSLGASDNSSYVSANPHGYGAQPQRFYGREVDSSPSTSDSSSSASANPRGYGAQPQRFYGREVNSSPGTSDNSSYASANPRGYSPQPQRRPHAEPRPGRSSGRAAPGMPHLPNASGGGNPTQAAPGLEQLRQLEQLRNIPAIQGAQSLSSLLGRGGVIDQVLSDVGLQQLPGRNHAGRNHPGRNLLGRRGRRR
ncbi:hypothetical protein K491DRAFT_721924 [Lophiostoma macrostomum CBS 122681]|uniref:Uncharacterized protein n=1 Tax=Lophiostoma macrostomum CBS 122681 TaxID=1314788 RepID=A0A6A6SMT8_9PLEO|nr:hypothetical protein K491DRAFT_721924 [Lophiostoma macrostomum CBS 122681]